MKVVTRIYLDDNGRCTCEQHAGEYLAASITANPFAHIHSTPIGTWERMTTDDIRLDGADINCERCEAQECETDGDIPTRTNEKYGCYYVWAWRDIRWHRSPDHVSANWYLWLVDENDNHVGDGEWVFDNPINNLDLASKMLNFWREV